MARSAGAGPLWREAPDARPLRRAADIRSGRKQRLAPPREKTKKGVPLRLRVALTALAASAAAVPAGAAGASPAAHPSAAACTPVPNIEAIIDDSGSMSITDPNRLRVQALDLLINTPGNEGVELGAVLFGGAFFSTTEPSAEALFPPEAIGPNAAAMQAALDAKIKASHGGTDYNAAFATAKSSDPGAKAWIFLTDGGHDIGEYTNGHRGGPPTYVIGFGSAIAPTDSQRLQQIASETGGRYFKQTDSSNLQAVVNEIDTTLTCQTAPATFTDSFTGVSKARQHAVTIGAKTRSIQLTLSWGSPLDAFTIGSLKEVSKGRTVATGAKVRKLKVTRRSGTTFTVVKVTGVVPGSLRFSVKPTKLGSGAPKVSLTTQVSQSH